MSDIAKPSPYQVGPKAREHLSEAYVHDVQDAVNGARVSLQKRLIDLDLFPVDEVAAGYARANPRKGDHILVQVLFKLAKHAAGIPDEEYQAKTQALTMLAKTAQEAIKEANTASVELQNIREHAEKMALEAQKVKAKAAPTLAEVAAALRAKPDAEDA